VPAAVIRYDPAGRGYSPRGAALDLWRCKAPEVIISGPAETGKTTAALHRLHTFLCNYPRSQGVMARKVRDTIFGTVLQSYARKVLPEGHNIRPFGGERPTWFDYPNGSRLWLAGLDDPGKALSSERDVVYVNQAEELTLADWETLATRTTGRAGNAPYNQLMGDCNPGPAHHWIKQRAAAGRLLLLESRHEDNPTLFTAAGEMTEQGRRTMAALDSLTGVRKERLRYGRWASVEGTVYEFDARVHLIDPFPVPRLWRRFRVIDFGYTNPFVCQWWAIDPDGRLYLYREIYMTGRTVSRHAGQIKACGGDDRHEATVADHDAEDRATLAQEGIHTTPAAKAVSPGIQAVERRLARAGDGRPRLFVMRGCLVERDEALAAARKPCCTAEEFDEYVWPKSQDGRPVKEQPLKVNDHGMDCARYACMYADNFERVGAFTVGSSRRSVIDDLAAKGIWNT